MDLLPLVAFILAFISAPMIWRARDIKQDRKEMLLWTAIGVTSTMTLMIWALFFWE